MDVRINRFIFMHLHLLVKQDTKFSFSLCFPDCCQGNRAHYDLGLAREMQVVQPGVSDYLVLHLSELVRVAFMAATSESDPLRLEGLKTMEVCTQIELVLPDMC